MINIRILPIIFCVFLFGCASQGAKHNNNSQKNTKPSNAGYLLLFSEKRPNETEHSVRMMITDDYLRIDEGPQSQDYELFDRHNKSITEVTGETESIHYVNPTDQHVRPTFPVRWVIESQTSQALMRTQQNNQASATHYLFYLNDEPCYNLVTIDNHLTETLDALREYNRVIANDLKSNYQMSENRHCSDAINIFDPNVRLQYGFPLREWGQYGYQRFLVDFQKDVIFPESLFKSPKRHEDIGF